MTVSFWDRVGFRRPPLKHIQQIMFYKGTMTVNFTSDTFHPSQFAVAHAVSVTCPLAPNFPGKPVYQALLNRGLKIGGHERKQQEY